MFLKSKLCVMYFQHSYEYQNIHSRGG